jgi:hypothetical protein
MNWVDFFDVSERIVVRRDATGLNTNVGVVVNGPIIRALDFTAHRVFSYAVNSGDGQWATGHDPDSKSRDY